MIGAASQDVSPQNAAKRPKNPNNGQMGNGVSKGHRGSSRSNSDKRSDHRNHNTKGHTKTNAETNDYTENNTAIVPQSPTKDGQDNGNTEAKAGNSLNNTQEQQLNQSSQQGQSIVAIGSAAKGHMKINQSVLHQKKKSNTINQEIISQIKDAKLHEIHQDHAKSLMMVP